MAWHNAPSYGFTPKTNNGRGEGRSSLRTHEVEPERLETVLASGRRRSRARKIAVAAVVAVLAGGAFLGFRMMSGSDAAAQQAYKTATVARGDLKASITATGTIQALNTVQVGAEVSGKIAALHADYNDAVAQGQLLAEIDPEQAKAAVAEAKAQVLAAQAGVAKAKATLTAARLEADRSKALSEKGLLSTKELEAAVSSLALAEASLKAAQASLAVADASYTSAKTKLSKTRIGAPISGTVLSRAVEVGQTINAGMQTPVLFTIAEDLRRMRLSSSVDEADIGSVSAGQKASFTVDAYPDRTFASGVESVRNVATVSSNVVSYEVILSVDNGELLLKPGMTASVEIVTLLIPDALLVPNRALRFTPPDASPSKGGPPRGLPFFGGPRGKKSGSQTTDEAKLAALGKLGARQAVVWLQVAAGLKPIAVEKLATDGANTAVKADGLAAGALVVLDVAVAAGGGK
jgi:HlyD family secretion protein